MSIKTKAVMIAGLFLIVTIIKNYFDKFKILLIQN
jgi:hypothetical protein